VVALSVSPDGTPLRVSVLGSHRTRLWPLGGGAPRLLEGIAQNVQWVELRDGPRDLTAGYDATMRIFTTSRGGGRRARHHHVPTPRNTGSRVAPDGRDRHRRRRRQVYCSRPRAKSAARSRRPGKSKGIEVALSHDGSIIAAGRRPRLGSVFDRRARKLERPWSDRDWRFCVGPPFSRRPRCSPAAATA